VRQALGRLWTALRGRRLRWPRRVVVTLLGAWAAVACAWWIAVRAVEFPRALLDRSSATSLSVVDAGGVTLRQEATSAGLRERWVALDQISPYLVHATLASEDNGFYDHAGVDWTAMARASWLDLRGGGAEFGGSTITMQLVRLTANTKRSLAGKLAQMVLAGRLERLLSKPAILEQYLNRVYYGNGAWGAEQAALPVGRQSRAGRAHPDRSDEDPAEVPRAALRRDGQGAPAARVPARRDGAHDARRRSPAAPRGRARQPRAAPRGAQRRSGGDRCFAQLRRRDPGAGGLEELRRPRVERRHGAAAAGLDAEAVRLRRRVRGR
jgi:hypothetical protein